MWTFLWLSHNNKKVMLLLSHFVITCSHTISESLSPYCDMTMTATVTTILVKEVVNMQIRLNSGFWRTTICALLGKYFTIKMPTSQLQLY